MADFRLDRVEEYNPRQVILELDGSRVFGWGRIRLARDEDINTKAPPSADGKHFWIISHNKWGTCELELHQDSPSLDLCRELERRRGTFGITLKDKSGTFDVGSMTDCKVQNDQGITRSEGAENYTFNFGGLIKIGEAGLQSNPNQEFVN